MTSNQINIEPGGLRADLVRIVDTRSPRRWTMIDVMSGRISRLTKRDWKQLTFPQSLDKNHQGSDLLVAQAATAGLLRRRNRPRGQSPWTMPLQALAFRLPLFSIDRIAEPLAKRSAIVFSPLAMLFWSIMILFAALSIVIGWSRAEHSVGMLYATAGSNVEIGYSIAILFVVMKCVHELGHAVACRRLGVPVGDVGVFFFCGVPCPYCDVSQVCRVDSRLQRAAVMMAGVYVELIVASIATLVWWLSPSGPLHLIAMNTMILCGVSAIVFNANPLMKLDGYFVISDALGTANLRRQASLAWDSLVMFRFSGKPNGRASFNSLNSFLAVYHLASHFYRFMIAAVILMFVMSMLSEWNLWWIGVVVVAVFALAFAYRFLGAWIMVLKGRGMWSETGWIRRFIFVGCSILLIGGVLCFPIRREVKAIGWLDVRDAMPLYVPDSGWVDVAKCEYGDRVRAGETLAVFRDDELKVQLAGFKSRSSIASLESEHLKRKALRNHAGDVAWALDQAAGELVSSQYDLLKERRDRLQLVSPINGVVLPVLNRDRTFASPAKSLRDHEETWKLGQISWCRIGEPNRLEAHLHLSAKQRQTITQGDVVKLILDQEMATVLDATVDSIDEMPPTKQTINDQAEFVVKCQLPMIDDGEMSYGPIGASVEGYIYIDEEPVWKWLQRSFNDFVNASAFDYRQSM